MKTKYNIHEVELGSVIIIAHYPFVPSDGEVSLTDEEYFRVEEAFHEFYTVQQMLRDKLGELD